MVCLCAGKLNLGQLDAHEDEDGPESRAIEGQENVRLIVKCRSIA